MARGPSICLLCKNGNENSNHIFLTCSYTYQWWKELAAYLGFQQTDHTEVKEAIRWWGTQKVTLRSIPLLLFWYVWKKRNNAIFREGKGSHLPVSDQIISMYLSIPKKESANKNHRPGNFSVQQMGYPRAFFDGAAQRGLCACGVYISMCDDLHYSIYWHGGRGTNNKVEAMALAGLLPFTSFLNIQQLQIYGDSKNTIGLATGRLIKRNPTLTGWINRIKSLLQVFSHIPFLTWTDL